MELESPPSTLEALLLRAAGSPRTEDAASADARWGLRVERMRRVERGAMLRAATAGAACGLVSAIGVQLAEPLWLENPSGIADQLPYYAATLGVSGAATVAEIGFLFWDAVRSALHIGRLSGPLAGGTAIPAPSAEAVRLSLARAGLETPPPRSAWRGIDPLAESSRLRILLFAMLYKLKVAGSSAVVKGLFRKAAARIGGRAAARSVVELAAAPVFAIWNLLVCRKVMREVRVRALGPHLAQRLLDDTFPRGAGAESPQVQETALLALRTAIVAAGGRHPNLELIGHALFESTGRELGPRAPDELRAALEQMDATQRDRLHAFHLGLVALSGRADRRQQRVVRSLEPAGVPRDGVARVRTLQQEMFSGRYLDAARPESA